MSQTLTIDDIWKLFQETNRLFQEFKLEAEQRAARQAQETERRAALQAQETERRAQEAERRAQEAERQSARRLQEIEQQSARRLQEIEQQAASRAQEMQEIERRAERRAQETDRVVKEVSRQIGQLGGRWGEFVESLVAPACETLFAQRDIPVHSVSRQVKAKRPGNRHMEIDLLVVNTDTVVLVEVKSKLKHDDVREHLVRLAAFKDFFPIYAGMRIMGAVAGIAIEENVDRFAMNEGLFVIVQSGDGVQLANDEDFVARTW